MHGRSLGRVVKRFDSQKAAEKWTRGFDFARAFSTLAPLRVEQIDDNEWVVINPGNVARTPVPKREPVR